MTPHMQSALKIFYETTGYQLHEVDSVSRRRFKRGRKRVVASPTADQIALAVVEKLKPAARAEFITPGNAEAVTGQDWRWVVAEAQRLGVPVGGTGRKRIIDITAFRSALAAEASASRLADDPDPAEQIRRMLGSTLANGARHGH